ncbi:MAG: DUF58 domain-containing protein [Gammaproteobacteria bacterium]|jgi:uncharacterized protein (DUF58 family)
MVSSEIHYKVAWRSRSSFPGHHASHQRGGGLQFRNHVPLIDAPDPRRFDVRASLRDPFEQIQVRVYQQTSAIPVYVVADLSASMSFSGAHPKPDVLADLVACISYSAYKTGDTFGFIGCTERAAAPVLLPATVNRAAGADLAEKLRSRPLAGRNAEGLLGAADCLGAGRALVFLVSDFHLPLALLRQMLASLAYHDVVPVVVWDPREFDELPGFGLARVIDPETARSRFLFMRPRLKQRIREAFGERRKALSDVFTQHGRVPLFVSDGFDPAEVTRYFFG